MGKHLVIDGVFRFKKPRKKRKSRLWFWLLLIVIFGLSFLFFGRLAANFVLENINPLLLLRGGKYLILLQNNAEIRSSGGFIGSYAVAEIAFGHANFQVKNLTFNTNIYALDRNFAQNNFVQPPEPVAKMLKGETWALRDANYDASFPEASQDILSFYSQETGDNVDGVMALNAQVIVDLLNLTGPIQLDKYNTTITAENFYTETQYKVEKEYYENPENWVINEPKTFLKDLYPEILSRAMGNKIGLIKLLKQELAQKEIIFYFKNPSRQQVAEQHNWAGKIPTSQELKDEFKTTGLVDYLYINSNSYSGNKSSINVKESIDYKVSGQKATVKITRIHTGSYTWPDGVNTNWERIFVPQGANLLEAKLNEKDISQTIVIGSEAEKTFFGTEVITMPGQASILELSYLLPFNSDNYHLLVQKQSGVVGDELTVSNADKVLFNELLDSDKNL